MTFDDIGKIALGSRLRSLSERITEDAVKMYALYGVDLKPRWFPIFYFLSTQKHGIPVTTIAAEIGQSHPAVIKTLKEMVTAGIVLEEKDNLDGRKNNILLSAQGRIITSKIKEQYTDVENAVEKLFRQTQHNLWIAMQETEYLLNQKSLYERIVLEKKKREEKHILIVPYTPKYREDFKKLNEDWITTYFEMEEADRTALGNPEKYILDKGGIILVALYKDKAVGVCALIKMDDPVYDYELAKMAVSPQVQGKGIGRRLGEAIIATAKEMGASKLYLESNTLLKPAITLYENLGFKKVAGRQSSYERANIKMELVMAQK